MKALMFVTALAAATPALAVTPPMLPPQADRDAAERYVRATEANDLAAYAGLFAAEARITTERGDVLSKDAWLKAVGPAFSGHRKTRFLTVMAGRWGLARAPETRIAFVTAYEDCPPNIAGCFTGHRTEVATVRAGKIVALETTGAFSHRLAEDGTWTLF